MKLAAGLVLAAVAFVSVSASPPDMPTPVTPPSNTGTTNTLTIDRNVKPMDPKQLEGLGPQRRPGDNIGGFDCQPCSKPDSPDNTLNDQPPCCENNVGLTPGAENNDHYQTLNPDELEKMDPSRIEGLGPKKNYPGVRTLDDPTRPIPDGYAVFYPGDYSTGDPKLLAGPGPVVYPRMPGCKNDAANKAWRDYLAQQSAPGNGGAAPECPTECVGKYHEFCGSNGITYYSECVLALDQQCYPDQAIAFAHEGCCQVYSAGPLQE